MYVCAPPRFIGQDRVTSVMSRIVIKGLVVLLMFLCSLIPPPKKNTILPWLAFCKEFCKTFLETLHPHTSQTDKTLLLVMKTQSS